MVNAASLGALVGWIALCFMTAGLSSRYRPGRWYARLRKPPWNPPNRVFAPVWTVLYLLMAIAAWRVWQHGGWTAQSGALFLFMAQLALNGLWSWLFFGLKRPALALADLALLWLSILATLIAFFHVEAAAGVLLLPYLAWVTFAGTLNYAIWRLNPAE